MKFRTRFMAAALCAAPMFAQWNNLMTPGIPRMADGKPNLAAPAPRTTDGKPDLSGMWQAGRAGAAGQYGLDYDVTQNAPAGILTPWAQTVHQQRIKDFRKDSPLARCLPVSAAFLDFRGLSKIVQTPNLIVMLHETPNSPHRLIFLDGRELPKDPNPTWLGYSVGHWEGDTLVVNTTGFNDLGWLDVGGNPQTESLRLTERFQRLDFGHLRVEVTFEDPKTFTKPFTVRMDKPYVADTEILEDVCENERDSGHLVGGYTIAPAILAQYAGNYQIQGREVAVTVSGEQLIVKDASHPRDQLFVARSDTQFLSSVSEAYIVFTKDANGAVASYTRTDGEKKEQGVRKK